MVYINNKGRWFMNKLVTPSKNAVFAALTRLEKEISQVRAEVAIRSGSSELIALTSVALKRLQGVGLVEQYNEKKVVL